MLPVTLTTDNGPQFISKEFKDYMESKGIDHRFVTPLWPQANGEVERQNRSILKFLKICQAEGKNFKQELRGFLVAYRTTPQATTGVSPADMLYGRKVRTKLPEIREVELDSEVRDRDNEMKMRGKLYSDKRRGAVERDIHVGDEVLLEQKKTNKLSTPYSPDPYKVIERSGNSVKVQSSEGVQRHRNVSQM